MINFLGLFLTFGPATPPPEPPAVELVALAEQQLEERNRVITQSRIVRPPVEVSPTLFSEYKGLKLSEALIDQAFSRQNHVREGFHFDPQNTENLTYQVTEPFLISRGIKEVIGVGVSNFYGSNESRIQNIMRGALEYDGTIIPKGSSFSFNSQLGEIDEENGYAWSKIIRAGKDRWGLGGGICQISTNIFRAALNAGLPISERRGHSYHLSKYSPAGLDATIFKGIQDLKFANDTGADILIKVERRGYHLAVFFLGTKDREVELVKRSHWQSGGRMATHWGRTVKKGAITIAENYSSQYSGSY